MAGSLDDQRCHVWVVPEGFQFFLTYSVTGAGPEIKLQMSAASSMTYSQVAEQLRMIATKLDDGNIVRKGEQQ